MKKTKVKKIAGEDTVFAIILNTKRNFWARMGLTEEEIMERVEALSREWEE